MSVRWGIWGPGRQARAVAPDFKVADGAELVAVGSRSQERADAFASEFGLPQAYGSLDALAASDVDAVFVTTPHGGHVPECVALANAGKHQIVEKSMATTPDGVREIAAACRANRVFCMEGMWTRFVPVVAQARALVADGAIGEVRSVQGDLHAFRDYDPADRLFNPELGGGALLDLGVYVVAFALDFLPRPTSVHATGHLLPNGVDGTATMALGGPDGQTASLSVSFETYGPGRMAVMGTRGWIDVPPRFHHPDRVIVHRSGTDDLVLDTPRIGAGYSHEIAAASACIAAGSLESDVMPLADTLAVSEILAAARDQLRG